MSTQALLVTGASGQLGRRVVELLLEQKAGPIIATTRSPEKLNDFAAKGVTPRAADFDDEASLVKAFTGAERALLISTDAVDKPGQRLEQHRRAIKAFEAAGVKHVVYTSLPNPEGSPITIADDHLQTEKALAASKLEYTVLRNNMYADLSLDPFRGVIASGKLIDARENGKLAFVTREDCARAAAAALAKRDLGGRQTFDVTGPEALTSDEVATILSDLSGKKIAHVSVPNDALIKGMIEHGLPEGIAKLLASFDQGISLGLLGTATDTVEKLTGKKPQSFRDFLTANRSKLI